MYNVVGYRFTATFNIIALQKKSVYIDTAHTAFATSVGAEVAAVPVEFASVNLLLLLPFFLPSVPFSSTGC
jgi:hypothetical protein